jgi:hypothetical protein
MANIFVSYNRQSKEITTTLVDDIESLGHSVWYDQELGGGQVWWDKILATVRACDVFVFVVDPAALSSTACKREYGYAADLGKPILPVLVSGGVSTNLLPPALSQIQFVDYRTPDRNAALRLARAFTAVPPSKPLPDPLPLSPEAPISYLGGLTEQVETTSTLSYQQQSALLVDLRRSLHDPETTDDARTLLARLRRRRDLFATIAEEIDEMLGSPRQAPRVSPATSVPEPLLSESTSQHIGTGPLPAATHKMTLRERGLGALIGAGVGATLGVILCLLFSDVLWLALVIVGTAGAITGAISGMHWRVIFVALAGAVLGFIVLYTSLSINSQNRDLEFFAAVFGAPIGAILGAIVGAILEKKYWRA